MGYFKDKYIKWKANQVIRQKQKRFLLPTITMMSSAEKVKGQGVGSAYREQVNLVQDILKSRYSFEFNAMRYGAITHYHTVDFKFFIHALFGKNRTTRVGYVHFIPETLEGSIKLPWLFKKIFYRYLLKFYSIMDVLVTVNPIFIDKLEALGFDRSRIRYIPNFVSEEAFFKQTEAEKRNSRELYGLPVDARIALGVGQVQTRKGVLDFIEVAKACPDIYFVWAGGFSFGRITDGYEALKAAVDSAPKNVRFLGIVERSEMNSIYNLADVLFLPSYSELFPMTILESMNSSLPLLLRDLELYECILFDYYLKGETNADFAALLNRLFQDADFYAQWSERSQKGHVFYSRESVGQMWVALYDDLCAYEDSEAYDKRTQTIH